ncbi:MAG TPA: TraR/DksA family transcriptional regulator [Burkholderiales bacterium]|nr:TraR/DksA family transcriptional regulator [Burkholderiales bacterium]
MALNEKQIRELTTLMIERRNALLKELREDAARVRDEPYSEHAGEVRDAGDESIATLLADLEQADLTRDLGELRALEAAREQLKSGGYGTCLDCGADIDFERLKAFPGALRCVRCQQRHEKTFGGSPNPGI